MTTEQFWNRSSIYRVDPQRTAWREVDGEGVVLDLETSVYFGLNRSAGALWPRLIDGASFDQLVLTLLVSVPAPSTKAQGEAEVSQFLDALRIENLLITDRVERVPG